MMTKKQMIALWLCLLNEATQIELPFVIAVFMVRRWLGSEAQHEDVVGRMTGILVSLKRTLKISQRTVVHHVNS